MSLIEQQRGVSRHVNFRDSKLTFLLQVRACWQMLPEILLMPLQTRAALSAAA